MRPIHILVILTLMVFVIACDRNKADVSGVRKETRIMDDANLLTTQQEDTLFSIIRDVESELGSQIAVYTIPTLNGESIDSLSLRIANEMKLGRATFDDGVLVSIAPRERRMRVEVGLGLQMVITNEMADDINTKIMAPKFREDNFYSGIKDALFEIKKDLEQNKELIGQH